MTLIRTFVAIEGSDQLSHACDKAIAKLEPGMDGTRWVVTENIHLTLKFLGEVQDREIHSICQRVEGVTKQLKPFSVSCRGIGAFPSVDKPNTIWIGVEDAEDKLLTLQANLANALAEMGFPIERRPYKPHITLGRTRSRRSHGPEWQQTVERFADHEFTQLEVDNVTVFSSELEKHGPTYTVMARYPIPWRPIPE